MPAGLKAMGAAQVPMPTGEPRQRTQSFDLAEAELCLRCDLWGLEGMPSVWPKGKKM